MERRVLFRSDEQYVARRPVPINHQNITAETSGGAHTIYTVRTDHIFQVQSLTVVNITAGAATLTLHSVPDGGSIGNGNAELVGYSIAANTAVDLTSIIGGLYDEGATLQCWTGTSAALTIHGWGEEII